MVVHLLDLLWRFLRSVLSLLCLLFFLYSPQCLTILSFPQVLVHLLFPWLLAVHSSHEAPRALCLLLDPANSLWSLVTNLPFLTSLPWGPCGPRTPGSPGIPFEAGMPGKPRPSIDFWNWRWFYHQVEYHHAWWSGWLNWTVVDCRWCSDDLRENSTLNEWWQGKQLIFLPENLGDRGKQWDSRDTKLTVSRGTRVFKWYVI